MGKKVSLRSFSELRGKLKLSASKAEGKKQRNIQRRKETNQKKEVFPEIAMFIRSGKLQDAMREITRELQQSGNSENLLLARGLVAESLLRNEAIPELEEVARRLEGMASQVNANIAISEKEVGEKASELFIKQESEEKPNITEEQFKGMAGRIYKAIAEKDIEAAAAFLDNMLARAGYTKESRHALTVMRRNIVEFLNDCLNNGAEKEKTDILLAGLKELLDKAVYDSAGWEEREKRRIRQSISGNLKLPVILEKPSFIKSAPVLIQCDAYISAEIQRENSLSFIQEGIYLFSTEILGIPYSEGLEAEDYYKEARNIAYRKRGIYLMPNCLMKKKGSSAVWFPLIKFPCSLVMASFPAEMESSLPAADEAVKLSLKNRFLEQERNRFKAITEELHKQIEGTEAVLGDLAEELYEINSGFKARFNTASISETGLFNYIERKKEEANSLSFGLRIKEIMRLSKLQASLLSDIRRKARCLALKSLKKKKLKFLEDKLEMQRKEALRVGTLNMGMK